MVTLSELLESIANYELELKGVYLLLALISVLIGIIIKLKWKPKMHKWFQEWLMQQEVVVEKRRSALGVLVGLVLLLVALAGAAQSNGGSLLLVLPALYLILHKKVRIRTQRVRGAPRAAYGGYDGHGSQSGQAGYAPTPGTMPQAPPPDPSFYRPPQR